VPTTCFAAVRKIAAPKISSHPTALSRTFRARRAAVTRFCSPASVAASVASLFTCSCNALMSRSSLGPRRKASA